MAIDPSISLGVKAPNTPSFSDYLGMAKDAQDIQNKRAQLPLIQAQTENTQATTANTQANTANLQAQNPGLAAQSTTFQQAAQAAKQDQDANNRLIELASTGNYTQEVKQPDGTTKKVIDFPRLYGDLASGDPTTGVKGYPTQALKFAGAKGDTDYKVAQADAQQATAQGNQFDAAEKGQKFLTTQLQTAANIIDKSDLPPEKKVSAFNDLATRIGTHYQDAASVSPYFQIAPPNVNQAPNGTQGPSPTVSPGNAPTGMGPASTPGTQPGNAPPQVKFAATVTSPEQIKALAQGSIDPLNTAKLANETAGVAVQEGNLRLNQLLASPDYLRFKQGLPLDTDSKAKYAVQDQQTNAYVNQLKAGIDSGVQSMGALDSIADNLRDKALSTDPRFGQLNYAIAAYNAQHPNTPLSLSGGTARVLAALRAEEGIQSTTRDVLHQMAVTGQVPGGQTVGSVNTVEPINGKAATKGTAPSAGSPTTPPPAVGTVRMTDGKGKFYQVPQNMVSKALSEGLTQVK